MYVDTVDDLTRKYLDTYILYDSKLMKIRGFEDQSGRIAMFYEDENSGISATKSIGLNTNLIEHIIVNTRYFNRPSITGVSKHIPGTLYSRSPRRQYKRSICNDNSLLTSPIITFFDTFGIACRKWHSKLLLSDIDSLLNPKYPLYTEALNSIDEQQCIALNERFALCLSTMSPTDYVIASTFGFVGTCNKTSITVHHSPVYQELSDFLRKTNQTSIHLSHARV